MNEKHINIRQVTGGFIVNYYENAGNSAGLSATPSSYTDTTAVFTTLEAAMEYVTNALSGAKSTPIVQLEEAK